MIDCTIGKGLLVLSRISLLPSVFVGKFKGRDYRGTDGREDPEADAHMLSSRLKPLQPRLGIPELLQFHVETIHQRQVQAAHLTVIFAVLEVVQRTPRL
jgi:hypothetical protein